MRKIKPKIVKRRIYEPMVADVESPKSKLKTEKVYPSISIPLSALPEAKSWKVGKPYRLILDVDMKSIRVTESDDMDGLDSSYGNEATFKLKGVGTGKSDDEDEEEDEDEGKISARYIKK